MVIIKQSAVDIWKCFQLCFEIFVSVFRTGIKNTEQVNYSPTHIARIESLEIIIEHSVPAKYSRVLCVQAEYEPYTQFVETFQSVIIGLSVLLQESIPQNTDSISCIDRDLFFLSDMCTSGICKEL